MSRHVIKMTLYLGAAILLTTALAMAQKAKTIEIYTDAVLPNGQELKAGKYNVAVDESAKQVTFMQGKKTVATHPCKVVEVPTKNDCNQVRYTEKEKKQQVEELRFGGERRSILLIQEGM